MISGCAKPQRKWSPPQNPANLSDDIFLHYLATVPVVTVDEGFRAMIILQSDPEKEYLQLPKSFASRKKYLSARDQLPSGWNPNPDHILNKGQLAFMLRNICSFPESFSEATLVHLNLGQTRYAFRTCVHEGIIPPGSETDIVTGGELLAAFSRAELYLDSQN